MVRHALSNNSANQINTRFRIKSRVLHLRLTWYAREKEWFRLVSMRFCSGGSLEACIMEKWLRGRGGGGVRLRVRVWWWWGWSYRYWQGVWHYFRWACSYLTQGSEGSTTHHYSRYHK
jgi:hypothetical protein